MSRTGSGRWQPMHWLYIIIAMVAAGSGLYLLLSTFRQSTGRFVKDWRYLLESHLQKEALRDGIQARIQYTVKARDPMQFTEDLGYPAYGDGLHFEMDEQPFMPATCAHPAMPPVIPNGWDVYPNSQTLL